MTIWKTLHTFETWHTIGCSFTFYMCIHSSYCTCYKILTKTIGKKYTAWLQVSEIQGFLVSLHELYGKEEPQISWEESLFCNLCCGLDAERQKKAAGWRPFFCRHNTYAYFFKGISSSSWACLSLMLYCYEYIKWLVQGWVKNFQDLLTSKMSSWLPGLWMSFL